MNLIDKQQLRDLLKNGAISFSYVKQNGEVREAHGTLDPALIEQADPKALERNSDNAKRAAGSLIYFDLDAKGYRTIHPLAEIYV